MLMYVDRDFSIAIANWNKHDPICNGFEKELRARCSARVREGAAAGGSSLAGRGLSVLPARNCGRCPPKRPSDTALAVARPLCAPGSARVGPVARGSGVLAIAHWCRSPTPNQCRQVVRAVGCAFTNATATGPSYDQPSARVFSLSS